VPCSDDPDGDVTGRIGDSNAVPVLTGLVDTEFDTDLVPVGDTAPDAVHGTGSVQQPIPDCEANTHANTAATTASANPDTYPAATAAANPGSITLPRLMLVSDTRYYGRDVSLFLRRDRNGVRLAEGPAWNDLHRSPRRNRERDCGRRHHGDVQDARRNLGAPGPRIRDHHVRLDVERGQPCGLAL
jgi:hypothetical protein